MGNDHQDNGIVAVTVDVFRNIKLTPREALLEPWLLSSSINMLTSYRGTGKTWAGLSIALAVASAGEFLTFKAPAAKRVLYIDGEMAATELQGRLEKLVPMFPDLDPDKLTIITPDLQTGALPDIATIGGQIALERWTKGADLIITDNLSSLARSGVENEAESWNVIATWALRMRREERAVLFVHHTGKNGQQRGTSKREDLLDTSILLTRPEDASTGACFNWEWSKARGLHGKDVEPLQATLVANQDGALTWACAHAGDDRLKKVQDFIEENPRATTDQVAKELSISRSVAGRLLKQVRDASQHPTTS